MFAVTRALVFLWVISWMFFSGLGAGSPTKPNVLFIAVDDLNDWIGPLGGHPGSRTPNLDRLASRGVTFTRAYTAAPACNPSRAALLTGVRPSSSGVYQNNQPWQPVLRDATPLPQFFKDQGYYVAGAGKIFHDRFLSSQKGTASYLDYSEFWNEYIPKGPDILPPGYPASGIPDMAFFDWAPLDVPDEEMDDYRMASWVINQLQKPHEKPLFLACGLYRPHLPWYVPRKYFDQYPLDQMTLPSILESDLDDIPPIGRRMARGGNEHRKVIESDNYRRAVQGYLASIAFADAQVGRLLDALDQSSLAESTIVVLWGDHGWHLGEKQHWRKFTLWEEAARTALIIVAPQVASPGARCQRTVSLMDIYPTLADLCGLTLSRPVEGTSLRPLLENPEAEWQRPAVTTYGLDNHAIRSQRWRYIRYSDGTEELYDHEADPMEWKNLSKDPRFDRVKKELMRWLPEVNAPPAPGSVQPLEPVAKPEPLSSLPTEGSRIAGGEVVRLMQKLIETRQIPPPSYSSGLQKWSLPAASAGSVGFRRGEGDYVLYVPSDKRVVVGDYTDLSEVVAPTTVRDPGELMLRSLQSRYADSVLSGFFYSSGSLEVVDHPLYVKRREKRWAWKRSQPLIATGGYLLFTGPAGVFLRGRDESYLISFAGPMDNAYYGPLPDFPFEITRLKDSGFSLSVAGKVIRLK